MNLIEGELKGGKFTAENVSVSGLKGPDGKVTLGYRAEDAEVVSRGGQIRAPVYSLELLGDATMATVRAGGGLVNVKANKDFRIGMGEEVAISIKAVICHLFDSETGARIGS